MYNNGLNIYFKVQLRLSSTENENNLYNHLIKQYKKEIRPTFKSSDILNVTVDLKLYRLIEIVSILNQKLFLLYLNI
jgi:hypothetical protein